MLKVSFFKDFLLCVCVLILSVYGNFLFKAEQIKMVLYKKRILSVPFLLLVNYLTKNLYLFII